MRFLDRFGGCPFKNLNGCGCGLPQVNLACWPPMLLALIYRPALLLIGFLVTRGRNRWLGLEGVVLRQQLRVLERKLGRPRWETQDRLLLRSFGVKVC